MLCHTQQQQQPGVFAALPQFDGFFVCAVVVGSRREGIIQQAFAHSTSLERALAAWYNMGLESIDLLYESSGDLFSFVFSRASLGNLVGLFNPLIFCSS